MAHTISAPGSRRRAADGIGVPSTAMFSGRAAFGLPSDQLSGEAASIGLTTAGRTMQICATTLSTRRRDLPASPDRVPSRQARGSLLLLARNIGNVNQGLLEDILT